MRRPGPEVLELDVAQLEAFLERTKSVLEAADWEMLKLTINTLVWMMGELEKKRVDVSRLQEILFGVRKTEKTSTVLKKKDPEGSAARPSRGGEEPKNKPRRGHGRNGADAYWGASRVAVPHQTLESGCTCPECGKGKVYVVSEPSQVVRVRGQAPFPATVWEAQVLRCHLCGETFTAELPDGVGENKYDETAAAMLAILKYSAGMPFNRLATLQANFGVPFPATTQWEVIEETARHLAPVHKELIRQAAQADLFHSDDTSMKILTQLEENKWRLEQDGSKARTGTFTTCILAISEGKDPIALFFTGRNHAGENMEALLNHRSPELEPPILMCDGSSRNQPKGHETDTANCLIHGRRKFVETMDSFLELCRHVILTLREVYKNEATTREQNMSPQERLRFHQAHSAGLMDDLRRWMTEQLAAKKVEDNSAVGGAISYMLKRWDKLTLFLRKAGAPLDNNICERAAKKAILHRKNAYFYKTENGAQVGDLFMSMLYTSELAGVNCFDYLTQLLRHREHVRRSPQEWMPWNYQSTVAALADGKDPPAQAAPP
jgi:transposase